MERFNNLSNLNIQVVFHSFLNQAYFSIFKQRIRAPHACMQGKTGPLKFSLTEGEEGEAIKTIS